VLSVLAGALLGVRAAVADVFRVPTGSMQPTLTVDDFIIVNRRAVRAGPPVVGEVVVFRLPPDAGGDTLVKRVVGLPGDVLEGRDGLLWRNGEPVEEPYVRTDTPTLDFGPEVVSPGHLWVMGDNRTGSSDSRVFGPIPREWLVGEVTQLFRGLSG